MKLSAQKTGAARPSHSLAARLIFLFAIAAAMLTSLALTSACRSRSKSPPAGQPVIRRYELKGRVESLDFDRQRVTIAHDEIKGYMDGMTMSFAVNDAEVLRKLKSGDQVQAALVHDSATNRTWLEEIKLIDK